jgi:hypothetical protein
MPRLSIQHFRAQLASHSPPSVVVRAYRELARRPEVAAGMVHGDWSTWQQEIAPAAA